MAAYCEVAKAPVTGQFGSRSALNVPGAGKFIEGRFGPGIQHLAFESEDIFAQARRMKAQGFGPLEISPNYFDDVEARFGLDPAFADRLRRDNILYDEDDHGCFLQVYSPTFDNSFFFEFVERRSGYRGYGGPNAPFRIAAQRRGIALTDAPSCEV